MAIPSVMQGLVEAEDGRVFEIDSTRGMAWLEAISSFRFEPATNKPFTARKESGKGGSYWYGYRKMSGKLHKKYIGKTSELSMAKLEAIAEALNIPSQSQVTDKSTEVTGRVTGRVTDGVTDDRLAALELQVQSLQESLEALQGILLGKCEGLSDAPELLKSTEVTHTELQAKLQTELQTEVQVAMGNLTAENESLKLDYAKLLENSTRVTNSLKEEVQRLRSQLDAQKADWDELLADFENSEAVRGELILQVQILESELEAVRTDRPEPENQSPAPAVAKFPESAVMLNRLKGQDKKSKISLRDVEVLRGIMIEFAE